SSGNLLMTTDITAANGGFVATDFNVAAGGSAAVGIVVDPNNGNIAYAVTNNGVFQTTNGTHWTSITDNILNMAQSGGQTTLASIALFNNGTAATGDDVLLVGGLGGVFRRSVSAAPNPNANWTEYGLELPNVLVTSLTYSAQGDTLLASTFGRSNWTLANVSTTISVPGILEVFGDENGTAEDDTIRLVRDAANPSLLDVFINGILEEQKQLSVIQQINVDSFGGNDTLIVDSSNGLITVPLGIRYDGGDGFDNLRLEQTGGAPQASDTYSVGPALGSGTSMIVGTEATQTVRQTVFFEDLEPVVDLVPSGLLTVIGTATDNAISYLNAASGNGLVTIDEHESIEFANKTTLTIDAGAGQDTISVNNPNRPAGLTDITVIGGDPSSGDTLNITGAGRAVTVDTALRTISGATGTVANPVLIHFDNPITIENLNLLAGIGDLTINTTGADDTAVVTPGLTNGANSGTVQSSGTVPQITFFNSGTFTTDLKGGNDALVVNGSSNPDMIAVDSSSVTITGRRGVNYANVEALTVNGNDGSDSFTVTPSSTTSMFIDGGNPIGVLPGDQLTVLPGGADVTFNAGSAADQGSFVVGTSQPVNFAHM